MTRSPDEPVDDIVLVDDDPLVAEFVRRVLRGSGRSLTVFEDPEAALEHLDDRLARVLVVDLRMPTMDGPELLGRLAARGRAAALRIILCSAGRVPRADTPPDVEFLSKDVLLDRHTLLERLGGALRVPPARADRFPQPSSAAESSGSSSNRSPTSP